MKFAQSILFLVAMYSVPLSAAEYMIPELTHVYTDAAGQMALKWTGAPNPGPCGGTNNGWVLVEAQADNTLKSFILALYVSGKAARISTSGCNGSREIVVGVYSPTG